MLPRRQAKAKSSGTANPAIVRLGASNHPIIGMMREISRAIRQTGEKATAKAMSVAPIGTGEDVSNMKPIARLPKRTPATKQVTENQP